MIIRQFYTTRRDDVNLYKSYSDQHLKIQKRGTEEIYDEAIDVETSTFIYDETDQPITLSEPIEGEINE